MEKNNDLSFFLFAVSTMISTVIYKYFFKDSIDLPKEQIRIFEKDGVLHVRGVLSKSEVDMYRNQFHETLRKHGCNVNDLENSAQHLGELSSTGGAGGILDIFYASWKLKLNEHPKVNCLNFNFLHKLIYILRLGRIFLFKYSSLNLIYISIDIRL